MTSRHTPGSYTKNFSWHHSYQRLHGAIRSGFSSGLRPIPREKWRERSGIGDSDRELIPLNFFLYSMRGFKQDYIVVDRLVERTFVAYDSDFAKLALFTFHLATSGNWHHSKWVNGKVAGWANSFIRNVAWHEGQWDTGAFTKRSMARFLNEEIDGQPVTKRKILTNYRYMLTSADILIDDEVRTLDLRAAWITDATQLFWDRKILGGDLHERSSAADFEAAFMDEEIYKLLACSPEQGRAVARATYRDYLRRFLPTRLQQLESLKLLLAA